MIASREDPFFPTIWGVKSSWTRRSWTI